MDSVERGVVENGRGSGRGHADNTAVRDRIECPRIPYDDARERYR